MQSHLGIHPHIPPYLKPILTLLLLCGMSFPLKSQFFVDLTTPATEILVGESVVFSAFFVSEGTIVSTTSLFSFGDGTSEEVTGSGSTSVSATHVYTDPGTYLVRVDADALLTNESIVSSADSLFITVIGPEAVLEATPTAGAAPLTVAFDGAASTPEPGTIDAGFLYTFDFGDGSDAVVTTESTAVHTYTAPGTYEAVLTYSIFLEGETLEDTDAVTIEVGDGPTPPTAILTATPTAGTAPFFVTLNGSESLSGSGTIISYVFDPGDGTGPLAPTSEPTITYEYTTPGVFFPSLTVTNSDELEDSDAGVVIEVSPELIADLTASPESGPFPLEVAFDASESTLGDGAFDEFITGYFFDFGDGSSPFFTTAAEATHTYSEPGTYTATVEVLADTIIFFDEALSISIDTSDQASVEIEALVLAPPTADLSVSPTIGVVPFTVTLDASASTDTDGIIGTYTFDFGDGSAPLITTEPIVEYEYTTAGSFDPSVTVTDNDELTDEAFGFVDAFPPLVAMLTATPASGDPPLLVTFDASGSSFGDPDLDPAIESYEFDFGDGVSLLSESPIVTHEYPAPGIYTATVKAIAEFFDSEFVIEGSASVTITVFPPLEADLQASPTVGIAPLVVNFDGTGSNSPESAIALYEINFNDGSPSFFSRALPIIDHVYEEPGIYDPFIVVTDANGLIDTAFSETISVLPALGVTLTATPNAGAPPLDVAFTIDGLPPEDTSPFFIAIDEIILNFGDGNSQVVTDPTAPINYTYPNTGRFIASLDLVVDVEEEVFNPPVEINGPIVNLLPAFNVVLEAVDTATVEVDFTPVPPTAELVATPNSGTAPLTVELDGAFSFDPDGQIQSYTFEFGDGNQLTLGQGQVRTEYTYEAPGIYTAILTVTDDDGLTDSDVATIVVDPNPFGCTSPAILDAATIPERVCNLDNYLEVNLIAGEDAWGVTPVDANGGVNLYVAAQSDTPLANNLFIEAYSASGDDCGTIIQLEDRVQIGHIRPTNTSSGVIDTFPQKLFYRISDPTAAPFAFFRIVAENFPGTSSTAFTLQLQSSDPSNNPVCNDRDDLIPDQVILEIDAPDSTILSETLQAVLDLGLNQAGACDCASPPVFLFEDPEGDTIDIDIVLETAKQKGGQVQGENNYRIRNEQNQFAQQVIIADAIPSGGTGQADTILVAFIDTGVDTSIATLNPVVGTDVLDDCVAADSIGYDFSNEQTVQFDLDGHGTPVAAVLSSDFPTATNLDLVSLKFYENEGTLFGAICGIYYAIQVEADVLNMSWGIETDSPPQQLFNAINAADSAGIFMVVSAGNDAEPVTERHFPATINLESNALLTVAALSNPGTIAPYSNFDPEVVDIAALGAYMAPVPNRPDLEAGIDTVIGTSFAAPAVARAAAILRVRFPELTNAEIGSILKASANKSGSLSSFVEEGNVLDLEAALALAGAGEVPFRVIGEMGDLLIEDLATTGLIDLNAIGNINYSIEASFDPESTGSVLLELSGPESITRVESVAPYSLFGGAFSSLPVGNYTLTATPFSESGGMGAAGTPVAITFEVRFTTGVTGFRVVALADVIDPNLIDEDILEINEFGAPVVNIEAVTSPDRVGSVRLELAGPITSARTENSPPYSVFPGFSRLETGQYNLVATPFTERDGMGMAGTPQQIGFSVVEIENALIAPDELQVEAAPQHTSVQLILFPNPVAGQLRLVPTKSILERVQLRLVNTLGMEVYREQFDQLTEGSARTIDLSALPSGVYSVVFEVRGQQIYRQLLQVE